MRVPKVFSRCTVNCVLCTVFNGEVAELAEGGRLEICCGGNSTGGSNPSLSAMILK